MHPLIAHYPLISQQVNKTELSVILREFEATLAAKIDGDVVELGCYTGTTSLFIQRLLVQQSACNKTFHVYDSFAGLPSKAAEDASPTGTQFTAGELSASKADFITNFRKASLPLPIIHKAWFAELTPNDLPSRIAFAFLDSDFYESIRRSLELVWPFLAPDATVVVDDYQSTSLPGARRAVDSWLRTHPAKLRVEASLAIIRLTH